MSAKLIGEKLKELRIKAGLSPKEVYERLGVKQARFSAWETGKAEPSIDNLLALCKIYGVNDIFETFGYNDLNDDFNLNDLEDEDVELLRNAKKCSEEDRRLLNELALSLAVKSGLSTHSGQKQIKFYDLEELEEPGFDTFGDLFETYTYKSLPAEIVPKGTDFVVEVLDNSMEPMLSKGDLAFFKSIYSEAFDISDERYFSMEGIKDDVVYLFSVYHLGDDGSCETLIRTPLFDKAFMPSLIPMNKNYSYLPIIAGDEVYAYGRLVGHYHQEENKEE